MIGLYFAKRGRVLSEGLECDWQEEEAIYIYSSHLGLIRCPIIPHICMEEIQTIHDKSGNTNKICLPHEIQHGDNGGRK